MHRTLITYVDFVQQKNSYVVSEDISFIIIVVLNLFFLYVTMLLIFNKQLALFSETNCVTILLTLTGSVANQITEFVHVFKIEEFGCTF